MKNGLTWLLCAGMAAGMEPMAAADRGLSREAAVHLVQAVARSFKLESPGLNSHDLGGFAVAGGAQVYFQYVPAERALHTYALIYKFHRPPRPGVLDGFQAEQKAGTDTGGGTVEYQIENRGLYLSRTYTAPPDDQTFVAETMRLMRASQVWGGPVLERVSAKVFHPGP